ncbi:uncharacterized protein [Haliotis cracherodii]|uniref:uncharacterized protein n=1 Tax=Haliotis cracherodii TaxID=6455 RepID=UPI0039ED5D69
MMYVSISLFLSLSAMLFLSGVTGAILGSTRYCLSGRRDKADDTNCHYYWDCFNDVAYKKACPPYLCFNDVTGTCDDAAKVTCNCVCPFQTSDNPPDVPEFATAAIEQLCSGDARTIPHPSECHKYYDCALASATPDVYFAKYEAECPYPQLFSSINFRCQDFKTVDCGQRAVKFNYCDYSRNKCTGPNCIPCSESYPSCQGLEDGPNLHQGREGTAFYVTCDKGRTIGFHSCPDVDGIRQVFHPDTRSCRPYAEVISYICAMGAAKVEHPTKCNLYYDCSSYIGGDSYVFPDYLKECSYPDLFSTVNMRCQHHTTVSCWTRTETKRPCDYQFSCSEPPCATCQDNNFASCVGLPDGNNVFKTREGSPHYVICQGERTLALQICGTEGLFYKEFSPTTRQCESRSPLNPGN